MGGRNRARDFRTSLEENNWAVPAHPHCLMPNPAMGARPRFVTHTAPTGVPGALLLCGIPEFSVLPPASGFLSQNSKADVHSAWQFAWGFSLQRLATGFSQKSKQIGKMYKNFRLTPCQRMVK